MAASNPYFDAYDDYASYGFVDVGEPTNGGGYSLKRTKSYYQLSEMTPQHFKQLERQIRLLEEEVATLKKKVAKFEANNSQWGVRYSKRMAMLGNLMLGLWIFWSRIFKFFRKRKNRLLQTLMVPRMALYPHRGNRVSRRDVLSEIFYDGIWDALKHSWVFFVASLLITRKTAWKRHIGLVLSTANSLYLAFFSKLLPWTNYFNLFANLLYITATSKIKSPTPVPTLRDYIVDPSAPSTHNLTSSGTASPPSSVGGSPLTSTLHDHSNHHAGRAIGHHVSFSQGPSTNEASQAASNLSKTSPDGNSPVQQHDALPNR